MPSLAIPTPPDVCHLAWIKSIGLVTVAEATTAVTEHSV